MNPLIAYLNSKAKSIPFNTNNAWGFGGADGLKWNWRNIEVKVATASTRHAGTTRFLKLTVGGEVRRDLLDTSKNRKQLLIHIKTI